MPDSATRAAVQPFLALNSVLFNALFPDTCRVCETPLKHFSRIPVCPDCLHAPEPIAAEFFCVACHTPFLNRSPLDESGRCSLCRLGLSGFDQVYTFGSYEGSLRKLIHLFKYQGVQPLAPVLGGFLKRALPVDEHFDLIIPMPLHWRRRWSRGFNQSALLAREIARRFNAPVTSALRRVRFTPSQAGLTNAARRANMSGAFRIKPGTHIKGKRVLLIDDVLTTGATASACARVLKRAGAAHVTLLAVARTDRRDNQIENLIGRPAKAFAAAAHTEETA